MEYQEWKAKYYTGNEEYFKNYYKKYGKEYRELNKRKCIYRLINKNGEILMIGSTTDFKVRKANYYSNNTSIKLMDNWDKYNLDYFEVCYLDNSINRDELYYIEDWCIKNTKTVLNQNGAYCEDNRIKLKKKGLEVISNDRKKELEEIAKNLVFKKDC